MRNSMKEVTIVETQGGVGNQLFQYAFARQLSADGRVPVVLDPWRHSLPGARPFALASIVSGVTVAWDAKHLPGPRRVVNRIVRSRWARLRRRSQIFEDGLAFQQELLRAPSGVRIVGYFQSWRYFQGIEWGLHSEFKRLVSRPSHIDRANQDLDQDGSSCRETPKVAVHVRRGDYLEARFKGLYPRLGQDYYGDALNKMRDSLGKLCVVLYSDDPRSAAAEIRPLLRANEHMHFGEQFVTPLQTLLAMSKRDAFVLANSSFSWWAAWMSDCPHTLRIAPSMWIRREDFLLSDLIPPTWTTLNT